MKTLTFLAFIAFAAVTLTAQAKPATAADYNGAFQYAVSETNTAFPFVYTVVTETLERGKLVSTEIEVSERQAQGVERGSKTLVRGGKTLRSYSVMLGYDGKTYCSKDGILWTGPQENVCPGPDGTIMFRLQGPRPTEKVEYSVTEEALDGELVKVYRKYTIYPPYEPNEKRTFEQETAIIDSRGFFVSVIDEEGTLNPKTVTERRKQTWDFKTKIKPVVAPK